MMIAKIAKKREKIIQQHENIIDEMCTQISIVLKIESQSTFLNLEKKKRL